MKWIAALLMIVNVAVYLWASGRQITVDEIVNASKPDVNKEGMLLLRETEAVKEETIALIENDQDKKALVKTALVENSRHKVTAIEQADNTTETSARITQSNGEIGSNDLAGQATTENTALVEAEDGIVESEENEQRQISQLPEFIQSCYRVGPFKKDDSWLAALAWMDAQQFPFKHITSESRELRAVRVYLGPYNSIDAASSTVNLLKGKSLDHFVYQVENGLARISLGYFTQEALASKFIEHLKAIEVEAKSQAEYRTLGPFNWMEIPFGNVDEARLTNHKWREDNVSLSKVDC